MLKINTEYDQPIFKTITIKKSPFYKQSPGICVFKSEFEADRVIPAGSQSFNIDTVQDLQSCRLKCIENTDCSAYEWKPDIESSSCLIITLTREVEGKIMPDITDTAACYQIQPDAPKPEVVERRYGYSIGSCMMTAYNSIP